MSESLPTIKPELRELILRGLAAGYISHSSCDEIETGNHYQSVLLGDERTQGFRTARDEVFDKIDFTGKKVLDLGSNLGELSRAARRRGARLVDGFEYDPYFVELANAINAYNQTTRVSFYQCDISDPVVYSERYDVVLAFSVFPYIHRRLAEIAALTDELVVLETHKLNGNLETTYLKTLSAHFPAYALLGETEWGVPHGHSERRAVLALGSDDATVARNLVAR